MPYPHHPKVEQQAPDGQAGLLYAPLAISQLPSPLGRRDVSVMGVGAAAETKRRIGMRKLNLIEAKIVLVISCVSDLI